MALVRIRAHRQVLFPRLACLRDARSRGADLLTLVPLFPEDSV